MAAGSIASISALSSGIILVFLLSLIILPVIIFAMVKDSSSKRAKRTLDASFEVILGGFIVYMLIGLGTLLFVGVDGTLLGFTGQQIVNAAAILALASIGVWMLGIFASGIMALYDSG